MSKNKPVRDLNAAALPASNVPKRIALTQDNAPLFAAKFLDGIHQELKAIRILLEKQSG